MQLVTIPATAAQLDAVRSVHVDHSRLGLAEGLGGRGLDRGVALPRPGHYAARLTGGPTTRAGIDACGRVTLGGPGLVAGYVALDFPGRG